MGTVRQKQELRCLGSMWGDGNILESEVVPVVSTKTALKFVELYVSKRVKIVNLC